MIKKIISLVFLINAGICIAHENVDQKINERAEQYIEQVKTEYIDQCEQEYSRLMNEFYEITGMNEQQLKDFIEQERPRYEQAFENHALRNSETQCYVDISKDSQFFQQALPLINKMGLNDKRIKLYFNPIDENIFAGISDITMGNKYYPNFDLQAQAAFLHELVHLKFDDCLVSNCLRPKLIDHPQKEKFLRDWNHFVEMRADIYSALLDMKYAYAHYLNMLKTNEPATEWHPASQDRAVLNLEIYQKMLNCYDMAETELEHS